MDLSAYAPSNGVVAAGLALWLTVIVAAGYGITHLRRPVLARSSAWALAAAAFAVTERLTSTQSPALRMVAIVLALLWALKSVVSVEERLTSGVVLPWRAWLAFAVAWFGMRPADFATLSGKALRGVRELAARGAVRLLFGVLLVVAARLAWHSNFHLALVAALLLPGLSLILHFGIFNLLAALWRWRGADCQPLFRAPLLATSLSDFWSRRWNLGFFQMASRAVFRPLRPLLGVRGATVAVFLFSGLLHELAISVPVRAGFGLPTLYFALHAIAVPLEKRLAAAGRSVDRVPWLGRLWTAAWLLLPLPLLFHGPFLSGCLAPLLQAR